MGRTVRFAENFAVNLERIRAFLLERDPASAVRLFAGLLADVDRAAALLGDQPGIGRSAAFLSSRAPKILAALGRVREVQDRAGVDELREYVLRGYLVLYAVRPVEIVFLSIRAQRERGYDL